MRRNGSIINYAAFMITAFTVIIYFAQRMYFPFFEENFSLIPSEIITKFQVWRIFTYLFIHDPVSYLHIFFNMYMLIMFGIQVEAEWGRRRFFFYYFLCGTGAGLFIFLIALISGENSLTMGASGAIFGIILAFSMLNPDAIILLFFILPIRAKYLVILYAGLELFFELSGAQPGVSHVGHLGGLLTGFLYFKYMKYKFSKRKKRRTSKKRSEFSVVSSEKNESSIIMKNVILEKLRAGKGKESLSDDEWQYIKYLDIIHDSSDSEDKSGIKSDKEFINEVRNFIKL
ncbi:MAG TPA: rhomboid family intramembrane serine protease [Spirochaetota bacterium]|nr:rhomboid family intramembrane serine protease [Spirochaetota bacterium]HQO21972.1 rhomboid family intramembrane serine protease [Spirochaetota bacterium]HQQ23815.1 rhomboid family intramembrane serine protease [Spirochaetota bacterium]